MTGDGVIAGNEAFLPVINQLGTTTVTYYAKDVAGNYEAPKTLTIVITEQVTCTEVSLRDFTLYVNGDYLGGHDVRGKVAAGGTLEMNNFSVGAELPADELENVLVAGGALNITNGGVFGNAHYGDTTTANGTVTFYRGALSQGSNVDFAMRSYELQTLSDALFTLDANGTTRYETWGGLFLTGTNPKQNVFSVNASAFTNLHYFSLSVPQGSQAVINVRGSTVKITGFGNGYSGVDAKGVIFNFNATSIYARSYGFFGTLLAPNAHVDFSNGSWDGGLYANSMTGNAEGHLAPLRDFELCVRGGGI
ncbi:MAG: choice-of-anchor A family protein [Myxococcaceae bacterium]|nr:choice-of-anchor A family protein [Myxococcaceae bacterium]